MQLTIVTLHCYKQSLKNKRLQKILPIFFNEKSTQKKRNLSHKQSTLN